MSSNNRCGECGQAISSDSSVAFCGQCLLRLGLELDAPSNLGLNESEAQKPALLRASGAGVDATSLPRERPLVAAIAAPPVEKTGNRIGRYRLLQEIGHGGCGVVYMAEQTEPVRRRVALKVIKLGMDTRAVVARFEAERQALALMDHSNIAKVLDAGATETGRPYFVMELVGGLKITDYCDQKKLPTRERLELFIQVCRAIQHAHQKGIIHRDIKPSNVLVMNQDGKAVPKVIDFGIAKATQGRLTDQTLFTAFEQFIGTPAYMSPEQAELGGIDVDTRSDIYALGVLLYELLTGKTPFDTQELIAAGLEEIRRTIREKEPLRPSTRLSTMLADELSHTAQRRQIEAPGLIKSVRGDLDWIVLKCLEKDRSRRYDTANGVAADIERHLHQEPVIAREPTGIYQLQKFIRRNRRMVIAGAVIGTVLVVGSVVSTWEAVRAKRAEREQLRLATQAQTQERAARLGAYASELGVAFASLERGNVALARQLLESLRPSRTQPEDLRSFEWRYLWGRSRPQELFTSTTRDSVWSVRFSPTGQLLAAGTYPDIRLWNPLSREELPGISGGAGPVDSLGFSPEGKFLVFTHRHRDPIQVWDLAAARPVTIISPTNFTFTVNGSAIAPDGASIAVVTGQTYGEGVPGELKLFRTADGELLESQAAPSWMLRACFSRNGVLIGTGGDACVRLWDSGGHRVLGDLRGHRGAVFGLACAPDGDTLATADSEGNIRLWSLATRRELTTIAGHSSPVYALAFSGDGKWLASGSGDHTVKVWDLATGKLVVSFRGHTDRVTSLDFSPDGHTLVSGSVDGTVRFWHPAPNPEAQIFQAHKALLGVCVGFSADGRLFGLTTNSPVAKDRANRVDFYNPAANKVVIYDVAKRTPVATLAGNPFCFSPNGGWLATLSGTNTFGLWDIRTFQLAGTFETTNLVAASSCFAFSPDGKLFAAATQPNTLQFWDVTTRQLGSPFRVGTNAVPPHFAFLPDGKQLVTWAAGDGLVTLWDLGTQRRIRETEGADQRVAKVVATSAPFRLTAAVSPDGRILANCAGELIFLWELPSLQPLSPPVLRGNAGEVTALAFSPDGKTLASASYAGTLKFWNVPTWKEVATVRPHISLILALAFSPEPAGRYLATGSFDDTASLWTAPSLMEADAAAIQGRSSPPP